MNGILINLMKVNLHGLFTQVKEKTLKKLLKSAAIDQY